MDASKIKYFIGIDISKKWLDVAVMDSKYKAVIHQFKCNNSFKDLNELRKKLRSNLITLNKSSLVIMEHSGFYSRIIVGFLIRYSCPICLESALQIKRSLGIRRGKSDAIDAVRIAQYGFRYVDRLRIWTNPREAILRMKDLLSLRERLVRTFKAVKTPLSELRDFYDKREFKYLQVLNHPAEHGLKQSLIKVNRELRKLVYTDLEIKRQVRLLTSVPGIGVITALYLISVTHEFVITNSGRKLASYMGVAPFEYSSGKSQPDKRHVSKIANKKMNGLIHTAAINTIRKSGAFRKYYDRKLLEGKHKMSVINAICNKILSRVSAVIKRGTPYLLNCKTKKVKQSSLNFGIT
jgi:transposase